MGIQGLLPFLDKTSQRVNVGQFKGLCIAIDAYCWLHKGAYTCAEKLSRGEACDAYVHYCMKYVNMLLSHNIKPILVFDGRHLPAKAGTEKKRRESRELNRRRGAELLRAGRAEEARNFLRRCVDVTHEMALNLIRECRRRNVDCIVAPYEADAQLAYLNLKNIAQVIITEDSDLVLFGCKKILFKMDLHGNGVLVEQDRLHMAMGLRPENFSFDKFRYMCILSGCDYLPSLPGIGLAKACKFVTKISDPDIHKALSRLPLFLNMRQLPMTVEYRDEFLRADATFRYQLVFDPIKRSLLPLTSPPENYKPSDFAGKLLPLDTAYQLALGNLNPFTLEAMDSYDPEKLENIPGGRTHAWSAIAPHHSIWTKGYTIRPVAPAPDPRALERPSTCGKLINKGTISLETTRKFSVVVKDVTPSNYDLAALYGKSPSPKKPCLESLLQESFAADSKTTPTKVELFSDLPQSPVIGNKSRNPFMKKVHRSPSPVKLPSNNNVEPLSPINEGKSKTLISQKTELSPVRLLMFEENENPQPVSPIITSKNKNPFAKKTPSDAGPIKVLSFDTVTPKNKFSALAKFCHIQTSMDGKRNVQSRYFYKTKTESKERTCGPLPTALEEPLHDISNTGQLQEEKTAVSDLKVGVVTEQCCADSMTSAVCIKESMSIKDFDDGSVEGGDINLVNEENFADKKTKLFENSSQKNVAQSFKWGPLHDRFGYSGCKQPNLFQNSVASFKSYTPPVDTKSHYNDTQSVYQQQRLEEENIDDPRIGQSQADSGFESISCSQDVSDVGFAVEINEEEVVKVTEEHRAYDLVHTKKSTRRVGLSKVGRGRKSSGQQSLLSMFGFQINANKFQHRQSVE